VSAAVQTLESALSDPKTPAYVRIKAAQSLLDYAAARANSPQPEKVESKIIVLPDNGRGRIADTRPAAAEPAPNESAPNIEPRKVIVIGKTKRERAEKGRK
jgi:hypothetical protein